MEQTAAALEFSAMQNETIRMLASRVKFVGIFYIVIGVLLGLVALFMLGSGRPTQRRHSG